MRRILVVLVAVCGVLLAGCGDGGEPPTTTTPTTSTARPTTATPTESVPSDTDSPSDLTELLRWVGDYSFAEILSEINTPPTAVMGYGLTIYEMGTGVFAAVSLSGFGSTQNIMAAVQGDAAVISVVFNTFIGNNPWRTTNYKPGDVLFTLEAGEEGKIKTTWGVMKPQIDGNKKAGEHFKLNPATPTPSSKKS